MEKSRKAYKQYSHEYDNTYKKPVLKRGLTDVVFQTNKYRNHRPKKLSYSEFKAIGARF